MTYLLDLGFLNITLWDALDVLIVGVLIYQVYRLLRGTVAIYILVGVVMLYLVWWLVRALNMDMLSAILTQFVSVGVLLLAIIFQPELRRFLLLLGQGTVHNRRFERFQSWLPMIKSQVVANTEIIDELIKALQGMRRRGEGALIVISPGDLPENAYHSGVEIDARVTSEILESIFWKNSSLHDGATILEHNRIKYARCVLPLSQRQNLPGTIGLRHRAAIGLSEIAGVLVFILSEENGQISVSSEGQLIGGIELKSVSDYIEKWNARR